MKKLPLIFNGYQNEMIGFEKQLEKDKNKIKIKLNKFDKFEKTNQKNNKRV